MGTNNLEKFYKYIEDNYDDLKDYINAVGLTYDLGLEFYLKQNDVTYVPGVAVEPDPQSRALMTMITKYALLFFEDKTGITSKPNTESAVGGYILYRPTTLPEGEYYNGDEKLEQRKAAYPFIYNNNYDNLYPIAEKLEDPANNGKIILSNQDEILGLVFGVFDIDYSAMAGGSGTSMMSMFGSMNIFNEMIDNHDFVKSQYDLIAGNWINYDKDHSNEAYLVLDANNELDDYILYGLGLLEESQMEKILKGIVENQRVDDPIDFDKVIGQTYKVLDKADYFVDDGSGNVIDIRIYNTSIKDKDGNETNALYNPQTYYLKLAEVYKNAPEKNEVKIVGVVRTNETTKSGALSTGITYTKYFTNQMIDYRNGKIETLAITGDKLASINVKVPKQIALYIKSFESKEGVVAFIDGYNAQAENEDKITYTDVAGFIMSTVSTIINAITYVLIAFVSVSLIVSSIMIGIITYISVIERTKEIGVLRSVGASKRDVKRVFTAESFIIGLASGVLGIAVSLLLIIPINIVMAHFTGISGLARLPWAGALILILISICLTFISGLLPAKAAAKKDPVIALREN
ncbi:MAG: ABC transporter permease [Clostridia bacterium]|nr:ABC transporter permease [Clostridia bacterium]